ncbi:Membrane protease YdiL, CAAX protease family [Brevibacterium siliguriense]|uniref:Membrane protease YdiL, CAAX protease family n=1 Tax=Brevibacterium siliguriense TaxID=1136497 RepID=A0A1H1PBN0_9MICO|nr:type II CAAX endopeptidase family protein [Brevibacterium siliguriense]SDS08686.1 Membrane protease YdiL, CAAX protease family [Brevibacterium siliguriense]
MNTQTHNQTGFAEATGSTAAITGAPTSAEATPEPPNSVEDVDAKGRPLAVVPARVPWLELGIFAVIAFGLAWLVCLPLWLSGKGLSDVVAVQLYGALMMFTPLIASIVASIVQRRRARARGEALASVPRCFGFWPLRPFGRVIWMTVAAFLGIMVLVVLGYFLSAAFGWFSLDLSGLSGFRAQVATLPGLDSVPIGLAVIGYLLVMVISAATGVIVTIGEEFGWRGWLLTSLRPLGAWPALLIIGVVWGLWHAPLILLGYNFNRPDISGLALMVGGCIMVGILFGWLRLRTGSVWPAVFAHAGLNGSAGMLMILFVNAGASNPDPALSMFLGVSGWIVSAIVVAVLMATGQFRRQPELGIKKAEPLAEDAPQPSAHAQTVCST